MNDKDRKKAFRVVAKKRKGHDGKGRARRYTKEFRAKAEKLLAEAIRKHRSVLSVAKQLGAAEDVLFRWAVELRKRTPALAKAWEARGPRGRPPGKHRGKAPRRAAGKLKKAA